MKPTESTVQVEVADGWWDLTESLPAAARRQVGRRAVFWYSEALPNLSGLSLTKARNRIFLSAVELTPVVVAALWFLFVRPRDG